MRRVIIFSGGLDSTVLLAEMCLKGAAHGLEIYALSINYGQRHSAELAHAVEIASVLPVVEHRVVDLSALRPLMSGSSQTDPTVDVPYGHYEEESMKKTVVPNRNMLMLAVAGCWAISLKAESIAYAAHAGDHAIYPDCREEFVMPLANALWNADWHQVHIDRPYLKMSKADIVQRGVEVLAPMELSYSCYEGGHYHCGRCGTCTERKEAFKLAGVKDPTTYINEL